MPATGYVPVHSKPHPIRRKDGERWVSIWSRWPATSIWSDSWSATARVDTPLGALHVHGVVLPDMHEPGRENEKVLGWSRFREELSHQGDRWARIRETKSAIPLVLAGDLNQNLDGARWYGSEGTRQALTEALVSWARGSYAKAADAFEDLVRGLDPDEGLGALVVDRQVETDCLLELRNAAVGHTADLLFREQRKPALDLVDPGAVGRGVVDVKAWVAPQPGLDQRCLVGAVVVEHEVDIELVRHLLVDPVQETLELDRAVLPVRLPDHLAGSDVKSGEQRCDSVPAVVMGPPLGQPRCHRQDGLGPVQGLDLGLLVHAEHESGFGRFQVKTNDVANLLNELRVIGELEVLHPMRLKPEGAPDPTHSGAAEATALSHAAGTPMSGAPRHLLQGRGHHLLHGLVADSARSPRARLVEKPRQPPLDVSRAPLADRVVGDAEFGRHLRAGEPIGAAQDDVCTSGQAIARLGALGPPEEVDTVVVRDGERSPVWTAAWHGVNLVVRPDGDPSIIALISGPGH